MHRHTAAFRARLRPISALDGWKHQPAICGTRSVSSSVSRGKRFRGACDSDPRSTALISLVGFQPVENCIRNKAGCLAMGEMPHSRNHNTLIGMREVMFQSSRFAGRVAEVRTTLDHSGWHINLFYLM